MKNIDVVVDLQFGSTGKGLFCGFLSRLYKYDTVVSVNMPNAGHTFQDDYGKYIFKILPTSALSHDVSRIVIGPGAVFDLEQFKSEVRVLRNAGYVNSRILVHENAWVLQPEHQETEGFLHAIGSTQSGAGGAQVAKIARGCGWNVDNVDFHRPRFQNLPNVYVVKHRDWQLIFDTANNILLEGAQGYSLSINGPFYPYTTSRDCTPARFFADAMLPISRHRETFGVMRTYPIRVGGTSGGWYVGQEELSWDDLGLTPERTTVTNRVRRIAEFSHEQIVEAAWHCAPDRVFLNFANYNPNLADDIARWYNERYKPTSRVCWVGYGPKEADVVFLPGGDRALRPCDGIQASSE